LLANITAANGQIDAINSEMRPLEEERDRLTLLSKRFERLSAVLDHADESARLDRILAAVLAANEAKPSTGWIQTPSVVLSMNTTDVEAIGGHNIKLTPSRATLRSDNRLVFSEVNGEKLAKNAERVTPEAVAPPQRPEALGAGDGRLFDLFQHRPSTVTPDGEPGARLLGMVDCPECTSSYVNDNGDIYRVTTRPPPTIIPLPGKTVMASQIADALREGRPLTIELVGFPPGMVADIKALAKRMQEPPGVGRFMPPGPIEEPPGKGPIFLLADRDRKIETLVVVEGDSGLLKAVANEPVAAAGALVEAPSHDAVRAEFGEAAANADASVVITFRGANPTRVAVTASGGGNKQTLASRLAAAIRAWLPGRPTVSLPQHLVSLRSALRAALGEGKYAYFVTRSGARVNIVSIPLGGTSRGG
jgi:hypothetical protein